MLLRRHDPFRAVVRSLVTPFSPPATSAMSRASGTICGLSSPLSSSSSSSSSNTVLRDGHRRRSANKIRNVSSLTSNLLGEDDDDENDFSPLCSRLGADPRTNRFHAPIVYHERYSFEGWPSTHTFPMDKFARLGHALTTVCKRTHPSDSTLSRPLVRRYEDFFRPADVVERASNDDDDDDDEGNGDAIVPPPWLSPPLCPDFVSRFVDGALTEEECRWIGFREHTSRPGLIERTILEVTGTVLAAELALRYGVASNAAGGTHHASRDRGAGYTILNDLAVAAAHVVRERRGVARVLVVDLDVHQGDGTARFDDVDGLFTLSVHCAANYPVPKARSTYDVALPAGIGDDEYMTALEEAVEIALAEVRPDLVLYDAGVDPYAGDRLGKFKLSLAGLRRRDRWVLERCVSAGTPIAAVVGGGYDKCVDTLARRHAIVHEECARVWRERRMWERCA